MLICREGVASFRFGTLARDFHRHIRNIANGINHYDVTNSLLDTVHISNSVCRGTALGKSRSEVPQISRKFATSGLAFCLSTHQQLWVKPVPSGESSRSDGYSSVPMPKASLESWTGPHARRVAGSTPRFRSFEPSRNRQTHLAA